MFQTTAQRKSFAVLYAQKHGLDTALLCALIEHESSWNQWAIRYEPQFFARYILPLLQNQTVRDTEARARAFSWGLMQILGQVAREFGFAGDLASLCDPDIGTEWGCRKLKHCMDRHVGNTKAALLEFNGGGDPLYPIQVKNLMRNYL
jgi:soluble lytic murein transglycosylase-like protein